MDEIKSVGAKEVHFRCNYCGKETNNLAAHISLLDEDGEKKSRAICVPCGLMAIDWIMKQATKE